LIAVHAGARSIRPLTADQESSAATKRFGAGRVEEQHDIPHGSTDSRHRVATFGVRAQAGPDDRFPFLEATVAQLQAQMAAGRLTSEQLTRAYIQRIQ